MGLMSFFSRKKAVEGRHVKSQPYDAAPLSPPPIRGTYPVAGNGPSVMASLSRSAKFKDGQYTIPAAALPESHSPPSVFAHLQDGSDIDRPRSAPNGPRRAITSSHGKGDMSQWPLVQPHASFSPLGHQRSDSLRSTDSSGRGFVDLLDAQSGIKHTDFHSRVKAAGARVYGEDVADRNIAAAHVKVDHNGKVKLGQGARSKLVDEEDRYRARVRRVNEDGGLYHRISKQISVEAELGREVKEEATNANVAVRRMTLGSILPGSNPTATRPRPRSFSRPTGSHVHDFTVSRAPEVPALPAGMEGHKGVTPNKRHSLYTAPKIHPMDDFSFPQPTPMESGTDHHEQHHRGLVSHPAPTSTAPSEASSRKQSRRKTFHASVPLSFASFAGKKSREFDTKSTRTLPNGHHPDTKESAPSPSVRQSPSHSSMKGLNDKHASYLRSFSLKSSPVPKITHDNIASDDRATLGRGINNTRSVRHWSMTSSTPTTAASSTTSSNPFPGRPQSQHTANTSVDMGSTSGASAKRAFSPTPVLPSDSVTSLLSGNTAQTYLTALESPMDTILSSLNSPTATHHPLRSHPVVFTKPVQSTQQSRANTMPTLTPIIPLPVPDDCLPTPSPSEPSPTQGYGQAEQDLLFQDAGYGLCGDDQLPGLGGRSGEDFVPRFRTKSPSLPNLIGRRSGYVLDTPLDYDETDDEAEAPAGEGWRVDDWTSTSDEDLEEYSGSDSEEFSDEEESEPLPEHLLRRLEMMTAPQNHPAMPNAKTLRRRDSFSLGEQYDEGAYDAGDRFDARHFEPTTANKRGSMMVAPARSFDRSVGRKRQSFPLRQGRGSVYA